MPLVRGTNLGPSARLQALRPRGRERLTAQTSGDTDDTGFPPGRVVVVAFGLYPVLGRL